MKFKRVIPLGVISGLVAASLVYPGKEEERFSARLRSLPSQSAQRSGQGTKRFEVPTFRITSSQVLVDFLAIDKQGRFVTDLRPDEVEIFEDGKKQSIDVFLPPAQLPREEFVSTTGGGARPSRPRPISPAPGSSAASVRRRAGQTVIVIDSRVMEANNFGHSVAAIRRFIEEHLAADHSVMIAEIKRGLRIITPMTRDRATLLAGLDQLKPQTVYNPLAANADIEIDQYINDLQLQVFYVREGLKSLSHAISGQPGRKHVVYFSEGYPLHPLRDLEMRTRTRTAMADQEARMAASRRAGRQKDPGVLSMVRDVVSTANRLGISFYAIDVRGLVAVPGIGPATRSGDVAAGPGGTDEPPPRAVEALLGEDPERGPSEVMISTFVRTDIGSLENAQNTLVALAAGTNGAAFYNTNDLASVLRASTAEQENYYLVSYDPSGKRKTGKFHRIAVKSSRPGVRIRARKGYLDLPDNALQQARFAAAFEHPELFQQLAPLAQVEASKGKIRVVIGVPAPQVNFRRNDTQYHAEVLFLGQIYGQNGKPVSKDLAITRGFNLNLTVEQFQGLGNQPLLARDEVKLRRGKYKLVLVVEDRLNGTLGATVQEFTVP